MEKGETGGEAPMPLELSRNMVVEHSSWVNKHREGPFFEHSGETVEQYGMLITDVVRTDFHKLREFAVQTISDAIPRAGLKATITGDLPMGVDCAEAVYFPGIGLGRYVRVFDGVRGCWLERYDVYCIYHTEVESALDPKTNALSAV